MSALGLERQADAHVATVDCDASVPDPLRFLADGERLGEWALGAPVSRARAPPKYPSITGRPNGRRW